MCCVWLLVALRAARRRPVLHRRHRAVQTFSTNTKPRRSDMQIKLSDRARRIMHLHESYKPRQRALNEAPPRTFTPMKWDASHPDLVCRVARQGAEKANAIKSRGIG